MSGRIWFAVAGVLAGLVAGIWLGGHPENLPEPLRDALVDERVDLNAEALELIEDNYFRPVDPDGVDDASIGGMVRFLQRRYGDRFSHYFDPAQFAAFQHASSGEFSGVGLTVTEVKRGLRASSVIADSPASRAGIKPGDVVVGVNGRSIAGQDAEVSTGAIKGPPGTEVTLEVLRSSTGQRRELKLKREEIAIPIARGELRRDGGEKVAYVALAGFPRGAHGQLRAEIERLTKRGARGIVLDLRGNGGGLLSEAVLVSSLFVEEGVIVTTSARSQGRRVFRAVGDALPKRPIVALINRDTASAAEILAAALQERDLATIVGTRSFGKGVFQEVIELPNGGALDLTVGEYLTSEGRSLAKRGIRPDVRVPGQPAGSSDPALERALGLLRDQLQG